MIDAGRDDSWRDSYDAWKLASPYDDYDYDECDHEDFDIDILDGRCTCHRCGERWTATEAELLHQIDSEAAYARYMDELNRKQWWSDLWDRIKAPFRRLRSIRQPKEMDDDIPF